jgi:hypothetical protein
MPTTTQRSPVTADPLPLDLAQQARRERSAGQHGDDTARDSRPRR